MSRGRSALDPSLLDPIDQQAVALASGRQRLGAPLGTNSELVEVCKQVFRLVLGGELGLTVSAFSQDEKEEAVELAVSADDAEIRQYETLLDAFGALCDRWPDVLDVQYGGSQADFREFRTEFIPLFLDGLSEWASSDADLVSKVTATRRRYARALRTAMRAKSEEGDDE